jgi:putative ABC transport system substrate-binding protein
MLKKVFRGAMCMLLLALSNPTQAQPAKHIPRIGYLSRDLHPADSRAAAPTNREAFLQGLLKLGYIEGKTIIIDYRYADGRNERLPALAEELVRLKVEIILADSIASATIPDVMASVGPRRQEGDQQTDYSAHLLGKRLELLKEVVPKVSRFAFLNDVSSLASKPMFTDGQAAAQALGVKLQLVEVKTPTADFEGAFKVMVKERLAPSLQAQATSVQACTEKRFWS